MRAFHGDDKVKEKYLFRVREHQAADEVIKGQYWVNGKGCAVGCTIHSDSHAKYETELGIPRIIARLEDGIFEGLSNDEARLFPLQFLEAISVGADLSMVFYQFMHWLLVGETDGVIKLVKSERSKKSIQDVAEIFLRKINGEIIEVTDWRAAAAAAAAAADAYAAAYAAAAAAAADADAAAAAAADAAYAAAAAADADAAYAYAAADAAADAAAAAAAADAYAAADAADADAAYAYAAAYAAAAAAAARQKVRSRQKDKFLEFLRTAPIIAEEMAE